MLRDNLKRIADFELCFWESMSAGAPRSEKPASGMAETAMLRGRESGEKTDIYEEIGG